MKSPTRLQKLVGGLQQNFGCSESVELQSAQPEPLSQRRLEELERMSDPDQVVARCQQLARRAQRRADLHREAIDRTRLGQKIRTEVVDPLLARERDIRALRLRLHRDGPSRASDGLSLEHLLERKQRAFEELRAQLAWDRLPRELKFEVSDYVQARRDAILHGDSERIREKSRSLQQQTRETLRRYRAVS